MEKETLKKDETYADTRRASPSEVSLHKQEHSLHARQHPKHEMRGAHHPSSDQLLIVTAPARKK